MLSIISYNFFSGLLEVVIGRPITKIFDPDSVAFFGVDILFDHQP